MRKKQKQKAPQSALETLLLVLLAALTLVPLFLVVQNSFKSRFYISGDPFSLPNKKTFEAMENYISGLSAGGFFAAFGRSLLITVVSVGLIVLCTSMAAWYLMRVRTALTKGMYYLFVFSMIVPFQMVMYTMTYLVGRAKLNTVLGMPFIYLGFGAGLSVFMLCGFIRGIRRELEEAAAKGADAVDAVSGATLVDTAGYLSAIVDAAKNAQTTQAVEFNGSSEDLKLNVVYGAAHGTKCFTSGAVATAGDTIVLSYIDEFQFAGSDAGVVGVPNSDSDFGAGYAEGKVLMSKRANADYYSKMMAEKAGSTVSLDANYDAIQNHVNGMSIADAEALSKDEKAVDAVSGATLVDTAGYVGVLVDAAK